jgi:hypothetical protein
VSASEILAYIVAKLDDVGATYMVVGSMASSYHAAPRSTQDIDIVVSFSRDALHGFVEGIDREKYYVNEEAARSASPGTQFNIIDPRGWKVDILVSRDRSFSRRELERRVPAEILGVSTYVATPEDTVLTKLEWAKGREAVQHDDVARILLAIGKRLDNAYLDQWAVELGVIDSLNAARRETPT